MKRVSTLALALSLAAAGGSMPANAQSYGTSAPPPSTPQTESRRGSESSESTPGEFNPANISPAVRTPVAAAQAAMGGESPDLAAIQGQLETAAAAVANDDDRYIVGQLMLQLSVSMQRAGSGNDVVQPLQRRALQLAVDSGKLPAADAGRYWTFLGNMANAEEDYPTAVTAYENALQNDPNNADANIQLALAKFRTGDTAAGYAAADRAIELARATGNAVPPTWVTVPLNEASRQRDAARVAQYGQMLVEVESTPSIWNQVLLAYASAGRFDDNTTLDMLRLLRATGSHNADTYGEHAALALRRGLPGEAQSVVEEAGSNGVAVASELRSEIQSRLSGDRSSLGQGASSARASANGIEALNTADAYASYGEVDQALALYRLAIEKGGIDSGTANLRLASTLAAAGRASEARPLLEGVTGNRQGLARFWLAWLDQQSGSAPAAPASADTTGE